MTAEISPSEAMDAAFAGQSCRMVLGDGRERSMTPDQWSGPASASDLELLVDPCQGPTLDVGCGPGRLTEALASRGIPALGIDISAVAVRQTRERGAQAIRQDVFEELPSRGRWQHVILADGNVGIGGRPVRLLERIAEVLAPDGTALVELSDSGALSVHENLQLRVGNRSTEPFAWATVGADAIGAVAGAAGFTVADLRSADGRHVATLRHRTASRPGRPVG